MQAEDHEELADQLDREAEKLERESDRLEHEIVEVRDEWHAKQADDGEPGATRPLDDPGTNSGESQGGVGTQGGGDTPGDTKSASAEKPSADSQAAD